MRAGSPRLLGLLMTSTIGLYTVYEISYQVLDSFYVGRYTMRKIATRLMAIVPNSRSVNVLLM